MKDIFQELYNKVLSIFNSSKEEIDPTKNLAVNRLKTVLMQDRAGFSERAVQMLKEELILTVSKYMEIDTENFELQIDAMDEGKTVLNLAIPVIKAKTDDEIDETIKKEELKTRQKAQEIVLELEKLIKEKTQAIIDGKIDPSLIEEAAKNAEEKEETEDSEEKEEQTLETAETADIKETEETKENKPVENKRPKNTEKQAGKENTKNIKAPKNTTK